MKTMFIIEAILLIAFIILCIETYIFFKKNENKLNGNVRNKLMLRMNIIRALTIIIALLGVTNIIINR